MNIFKKLRNFFCSEKSFVYEYCKECKKTTLHEVSYFGTPSKITIKVIYSCLNCIDDNNENFIAVEISDQKWEEIKSKNVVKDRKHTALTWRELIYDNTDIIHPRQKTLFD